MSDVPQDAQNAIDNWIHDGTPTSEPVTVETPQETQDSTPTSETETQQSAESGSAPAADATETPVEEWFVGRVGEQEFKVPKSFEIPLKRGEEIEWVPITEQQNRGMFEKDYRVKTQSLADQRRELDRNLAEQRAATARHKAREELLVQREKSIQDLVKDPEGLEQYFEHLQRYRDDPMYRELVDQALIRELDDQDKTVSDQIAWERAIDEAKTAALGWIEEVGNRPEFAGVSKDRVQEIYSRKLQSGSASLDVSQVEAIFKGEAEAFEKYLSQSPLRRELEDLKAQVARSDAERQANAHNAGVRHAMDRAKAPVVAPRGAPAGPVVRQTGPIIGQEAIDKAVNDWSRSR